MDHGPDIDPDLPNPVNFLPFGTIRYSNFAANLINIQEHDLHMFVSEWCLNIPLSKDIWLTLIHNYLTFCYQIHIFKTENPQRGGGKLSLNVWTNWWHE